MTQETRSHFIVASVLCIAAALATAGCSTSVDSESQAQSLAAAETRAPGCIPDAPAALSVPDGNRLAFRLKGVGVQIYTCTASGSSYAWVFKAPDADLFFLNRFLAGSHYVGPTWEGLDGSTVVGTKKAAVAVSTTAVPWLLLQGTSHTGTGYMSDVTYVQRLNTTGGLAPAADSCDAAHVGQLANIDYTAEYYFYKASTFPAPTRICK